MKKINTTTLYLAIGIAVFASVFAVAAPFKTNVVNRVSAPQAVSDLSAR
jgi:hypothetical protein